MNMLLALLTGVVISVMVSVNGNLTGCMGSYLAAVVIHVVGTIFAFILCMFKHEPIFRKHQVPAWAYLGGAIGILTTLFNNFAFGCISMTSIVALGLLGQSIASTFIDGFGLLGMKKHRIQKSTWIGIATSCVGVMVMLDASIAEEFTAVIMSLGAGISVVLSRTVNSRLSDKVGAFAGSFYNHLVGLPFCIVLWMVLADFSKASIMKPEPWMLCGGMLGVLVVFLCNITVPRISAFRLTLLSFSGQVFSGFLIDLINKRDISGGMFWGGVLCTLGFLSSMLIELWANQKKKKETEHWEKIEATERAHRAKVYGKHKLRGSVLRQKERDVD